MVKFKDITLKKNIKQTIRFGSITVLALVSSFFFVYIFYANRNFRVYTNGSETLSWKQLDAKYNFSKTEKENRLAKVRKKADNARNSQSISEDEKFYLNYLYYTNNYSVDPLEIVEYFLGASDNPSLTLESRSLASFSLINILGAYENDRERLLKPIEENEKFSGLSKISNFDDKRIFMLEEMYRDYPTVDNTVYLLYYLIIKYENTKNNNIRTSIKKQILELDFPVDNDIYPYLKYNRDFGKRYRILVSVNYMQVLLKLTENGIIDKSKFMQDYAFFLDMIESNLENKESSEYLKSNIYYVMALYKIHGGDLVSARSYLDKLKNAGTGEQPMNFLDHFKKGGNFHNDYLTFKKIYPDWGVNF